MGNKNEKTFTDLFSNSTTETETNTQTFSELLKVSSIKEEPIKEKSFLSFDSIFDRMPENKSDVEQNQIIDEHKTLDFNSIFTEAIEPSNNKENNYSIIEEEIMENENLEPQEEIVSQEITFNPFFDESSEDETTSTEEIVADDSSRFKDNNLILENNNPFFENDNIEEPVKSIIDETQKNGLDFSNNLFFDNNEINPTIEPQINNELQSNNILESNPFFIDDTSKTTELITPNIQKNNPFFDENTATSTKVDNINNNIQNDNNTRVLSNQAVITANEDIVPKSTSPFFEIEKKSEENPFFQNQINLIENQVPNNPNNGIDTSKSKHYNVKIVKKKEPLIKVILGVLSYALFIWLLLIGTTLLVYVLDIKIRAAKGDYSSPTFNAYVVLTGSMLPEIQVKDVVVTKKVDAKDLKERDVITFASADSRFAGTIITHRIIKKNPPSDNQGYTFQTKGDNNNVADSALVPEANIYGKVILKIPKLGYLQEFLASDGGWIIVILIPCLTVMSYDIVKLIKGIKRKKYKNIKVQK